MTGLAAGHAIGIVGDACVRAYMFQSRIFVAMVLILSESCSGPQLPTVAHAELAAPVFAEVIGLYGMCWLPELPYVLILLAFVGLIVALILNTSRCHDCGHRIFSF